MRVSLVTRLKGLFLRALSRITNRHAVLLPAEAGRDDALIDLRAPYRVTGAIPLTGSAAPFTHASWWLPRMIHSSGNVDPWIRATTS